MLVHIRKTKEELPENGDIVFAITDNIAFISLVKLGYNRTLREEERKPPNP